MLGIATHLVINTFGFFSALMLLVGRLGGGVIWPAKTCQRLSLEETA